MASPHPHSTTLACLKGLALTSTLYTATALQTLTLHLPALYPAAEESHRLAAKQFTHLFRATRTHVPPAELLGIISCTALAYLEYRSKGFKGVAWKLWSGAAVALAGVLPWTGVLMERPARKLVWVSEVASSATTPTTPSSGIGMKVSGETTGSLGVPEGKRDGTITPAEEFEPFEDAIVGDEYEQLKVRKLVQVFRGHNITRTMGAVVAAGLGVWAVVFE